MPSSRGGLPKATVLIVVGSAGIEPWTIIERLGQEPTWGGQSVPGANIVWMEPDPRLDSSWFLRKLDAFAARRYDAFRTRYNLRDVRGVRDLILSWTFNRVVRFAIGRPAAKPSPLGSGSRIRFPYPSLYYLGPLRYNAYLRYALENFGFDFLLRVTSTCYVDTPQLMRFLRTAPRQGLYAGNLCSLRKVPFVSGAAILFSRDVVTRLVANERAMRLDIYEDVGLGELVASSALTEPTEVARVDAHGQVLDQVGKAPAAGVVPFIYRCKVADGSTDNAEPVVSLMFKVHDAITDRDRDPS